MQEAPSQDRSNNWVEDSWEHFLKSLMTAAEQVLGHTHRKYADWFDENIDFNRRLLEDKYKAHASYKNKPFIYLPERQVETSSLNLST